ncbi:DUF3231 family protein [Aneurinibacillus sp. Ricciae_BoGa-3]|uniref:DUF3231 family protein n=1 Tax=Aneurinibacillus sp. Ricciae_BoGa-3 TaxID=3022697 RepID=UPI002340D47A|nr:DUF3231 family protein [Aneurinibacillus sp. Ricciae_BoGa-3]WCK55245.1 DUF3231 family protein [Aneurinibacillus sp. Ricciae_BoGa-3]
MEKHNEASKKHKIRLTSVELSSLWNTYMSDSVTTCFLSYFLEKVEETEIKQVIKLALNQAQKQIERVTQIFKEDKIPIPHGFGKDDVNTNAPRLYSDTFFLNYIHQMSRIGVLLHGNYLTLSARSDIRSLYNDLLNFSRETHNKATEVLLAKGLYIRPPYIDVPDEIHYVRDQSYLGGIFRVARPLNATEITHYYLNIQSNNLAKALLMGFSQVAKSEELREFFIRGRDLCKKQIQKFSDLFSKDNLPVPMSWDTDVTDAKDSPFSDKIMAFHVASLMSITVMNYGGSMAVTFRRDLVAQYATLMDDFLRYAEDTANIMIKHGWLEEMPKANNRDELVRV